MTSLDKENLNVMENYEERSVGSQDLFGNAGETYDLVYANGEWKPELPSAAKNDEVER